MESGASRGSAPSRAHAEPSQGYEVTHRIRKGQASWLPKGDRIGQVPFIECALGLKSRPTATLNHITTFSLFLCLQQFLNSYLRGLSLLSPLSPRIFEFPYAFLLLVD